MFFPELCTIIKLLRFPLVYCSFRVVTLGSGIHWKGRVIYLLYKFNTAWSAAAIITHVWSRPRLGVLILAKKCSTGSVVKLGKQISCAIYCKSFSGKNDLISSQMTNEAFLKCPLQVLTMLDQGPEDIFDIFVLFENMPVSLCLSWHLPLLWNRKQKRKRGF